MSEASIWLKLKIVLWKNFIIRKRHWFLTICEIVIPILLFILIAFARSNKDVFGKEHILESSYVDVHTGEALFKQVPAYNTSVLYAPQTEFTKKLLHETQQKIGLADKSLRGFSNELDLIAYYDTLDSDSYALGIVFENGLENKNLRYVIRPVSRYSASEELFTRFYSYVPGLGSVSYFVSGFIGLQLALDTSFIEIQSGKTLPLRNFTIQEFPYPPYLLDGGLEPIFSIILPLATLFSFIFLCIALLKRIVEEKSTGIKELMKMMGLKSWMLWLGWFIHGFVVNCFSIFIITIFMKVRIFDPEDPPIACCDASLLVVLLLLYSAGSITFCFAISSIFNKPTLAMIFGIVVWIVSYTVPKAIIDQAQNMQWGIKVLFGIFPNMALTFGYETISIFESTEVSASWNNLFTSASGGTKDITMADVFVMFLVQIVIFSLITIYFENVNPGKYGLAKPFHFPVSYLWRYIIKRKVTYEDQESDVVKGYCKIEDQAELKPGIHIKNLYKKFGKEAAVNGLSIDIYEGQITALLGHNGAGKTTTMSIITGMIAATSGTVLINDLDIQYDMNKVHGLLGLCPQHNLQFTDLTVMEHLIFFGMLKGLSRSTAAKEGKELLERMNLSSKQDSLASQLSGGMRRKLSLGIALIGSSKVLILDEPTSGLDPEARRQIWDILLSFRGSRTIIITTHYMEEADVLGDHIAIMDHGRLMCYGSSLFLKKEYGTGYHLTLVRDKTSIKYDDPVVATSKIIQNEISSASLQSDSGNQLTYLLPHETKSQFSKLFTKLEHVKEDLGITNIGMSVTTLEEVFLKVGNLAVTEGQMGIAKSIENSNDISSLSSRSKLTGFALLKLQLFGFLRKRWWVFKYKWLLYLLQVIIAVGVTILTLSLGNTASEPSSTALKKFDFILDQYGETTVVYGGTGASDINLKPIQDYYTTLVTRQGSIPKYASTESVSNVIIRKGIENIEFYKKFMVVAAEFNVTNSEGTINAMYSNAARHGAPISINLLTNAILKSTMGDDEYSISTASLPLPFKAMNNNFSDMSTIAVAILWVVLFPLGLLFLIGTFILYPLTERVTKIKQLQLMCGIRSIWYWLVCYIFDLILYLIVIAILLVSVVIYGSVKTEIFSGSNELQTLTIILFVYGIAVIPYSYLFSYRQSSAGGFSLFVLTSIFINNILTVTVIGLELSGDEICMNIGKIIKYIFAILPQFDLSHSLLYFAQKAVWNHNWNTKSQEEKDSRCEMDRNPCCDGMTSACKEYQDYFNSKDGIKNYIIIMAATSIVYFAIILVLETSLLSRIRDRFYLFIYNKQSKSQKLGTEYLLKTDKQDVYDESKRVHSKLEMEKLQQSVSQNIHLEEENDLLLVDNLEKIYWKNKVVNGVCFGVKSGDCFGLLGVNGAGKTTTFRMLTGDETLMSGDARISGPLSNNKVYLSKNSKEYLEHVGYCPQFDAINEILTGREMLILFAYLRGISKGVDNEVNIWLKVLGLEDYADKKCGDYSGGNKRKLSMAISLIGGPLLVMLDEPTSGVDPVSRRKLWDTLTALQKQKDKPSFLLTSHSMEECEALCNKLAIMKAGQFECYGTIPKLKQKYGQGFTVMLKLKPALISVAIDSSSAVSNQSHLPTNKDKTTKAKKSKTNKSLSVSVVEESYEVKRLRRDFESQYEGFCTLRDKHSGLLHYHLSNKNKKWSDLFKEVETLKLQHPIIEDYNISETTLEEVFLSIARSES